jgi:hypothetical protein
MYFNAFLELADEDDNETGLVVIADVICITPNASKQRKVEAHRSHFSEDGKTKD